MKLSYRGVSYDYNPPQVEYGDATQVGKYRGLDIRFRNLKKAPVQQPTLNILYRGATAQSAEAETTPAAVEKTPTTATVPASATAIASSVQDQARWLMMSHHKNVKRRQQSMLSRLDAKVGLPASEAARFWNHVRGEAHPSFNASYDRSSAAMS